MDIDTRNSRGVTRALPAFQIGICSFEDPLVKVIGNTADDKSFQSHTVRRRKVCTNPEAGAGAERARVIASPGESPARASVLRDKSPGAR
ncbi:hypothetical protein EVAR_66021_1 [Eumeta japonica]|uniref:Uncharacterized protein n=1 Tax=Eumeta variegata TaxID=151549 RepID=A0A4C1Z9J9_EUMVA|nr:hypothetical protein EVAR_66021_1 [Eumeta japonica]